jgi:hypothetical protein
MDTNKKKQLIFNSLKNEESCLKDLIVKIGDQKKAIEMKDESRVLEIIEEKDVFIKTFKNLEEEVETQLQLLSQPEIEDLAKEGETLKISLEKLINRIVGMEEECESAISHNMKEVEKRILGLQKGKKIGKGYGRFFKNKPLISRKV